MNNVEKIRRRFGSTGIHRHESNYILGAMQKVAEVLMSYIKSDATEAIAWRHSLR